MVKIQYVVYRVLATGSQASTCLHNPSSSLCICCKFSPRRPQRTALKGPDVAIPITGTTDSPYLLTAPCRMLLTQAACLLNQQALPPALWALPYGHSYLPLGLHSTWCSPEYSPVSGLHYCGHRARSRGQATSTPLKRPRPHRLRCLSRKTTLTSPLMAAQNSSPRRPHGYQSASRCQWCPPRGSHSSKSGSTRQARSSGMPHTTRALHAGRCAHAPC